jgi:hypothetical protein
VMLGRGNLLRLSNAAGIGGPGLTFGRRPPVHPWLSIGISLLLGGTFEQSERRWPRWTSRRSRVEGDHIAVTSVEPRATASLPAYYRQAKTESSQFVPNWQTGLADVTPALGADKVARVTAAAAAASMASRRRIRTGLPLSRLAKQEGFKRGW